MIRRDEDIQRLGELTGNSVEFRQFSAPVSTQSDWSLLNAVSRCTEPSTVEQSWQPATVELDDKRENDWSMLATLDAVPPSRSAEAPISPMTATSTEIRPELSSAKVPAKPLQSSHHAQSGFAHLFRKPSEDESSATTTPLAELLKAISRCP